ncbi:antibiotic biosynthesis monooxygenase [Paenibacillus protaetiae]|nr:antibiotic biosynthesis monooxygenase [Paenibacillus protaetiae]
MFVVKRNIKVQQGSSDKLVERFGSPGIIEQNEGFIDLQVMVKEAKRSDEYEEVIVLIRWESKEAWKNWEKSDAHVQGHRENRGKPKPEYVIEASHDAYEVKAIKGYRAPAAI